MEPNGARVLRCCRLTISRPRSEKPDEHGDVLLGDVLLVVKSTSRTPFVSEPVTLTKKDLGFWIGMALWIGPPLFPLLVLIVCAIPDVPSQGPTATIARHATAEAPAKLSERSSNGIGPADERHSKRSVPSTRRRGWALLEEISSTQRSLEPFLVSARNRQRTETVESLATRGTDGRATRGPSCTVGERTFVLTRDPSDS
jgi:hypothetical protein